MAVSVAVVRISRRTAASRSRPGLALSPAIRSANIRRWRAGALQLADAPALLKLRGQSMQKAVPVGEGAMAALLGIELEPAQEACKEAAQGESRHGRQRQWRRPGRGQRPQGGGRAHDRGGQAARRKRGMLLPVSAPFHCPLMKPRPTPCRRRWRR
jgi:[acyl-carrier-protein] S-malonyltransferase